MMSLENKTEVDTTCSSVDEEMSSGMSSGMSSEMLASLIFGLVNNTCVTTVIGLFGIVANIFNMIVFFKQGLYSSINISLFFMSISDTFTIIFIEWLNICYNPYIDNLKAPVSFTELYYITGGWPSGFSCRVTLYITVYITTERCLCILFPLTIKTLITPRRTKIIIAFINLFNALTLVPEYSSIYLSWQYNMARNGSILGLAYRSNRADTQGITFLLHVILIVSGLFSVIVLTSVLVIHLRRQTKWRMKNSSENKLNSSMSSRDRKSVVLVIAVATFVVVSYIPMTSVALVSVFVSEFYIGGRFSKEFVDTWALIMLFGMTNASANIIIYYKMNSKFRATFKEVILKQTKQ
uniref:G-protein coupled receptors family 1 profile domain-containing protein n=1 Tax=Biomphalaria glabrata TaxID=6526 RepID=A0A2C9KR56_BIOGL